MMTMKVFGARRPRPAWRERPGNNVSPLPMPTLVTTLGIGRRTERLGVRAGCERAGGEIEGNSVRKEYVLVAP